MFYKEIDKTNRQDMINFLTNHFRYNTMNSWNNATSYANRVKLHDLDIPNDKQNFAYELLENSEVYDEIYMLFSDFRINQMGEFSAGFNGRGSGYIVLYNAGNDTKGRICTFTRKSIDQGEDFEEWSDFDLKQRVELVQDFDQMCDDCVNTFLNYVNNAEIKEEIVMVPKTIKHLVFKDEVVES